MSDDWLKVVEGRDDIPAAHLAFLERALPRLSADPRVVGIAAGGSFIDGPMDRYSDLDLIVASEPAAAQEVLEQGEQIAAALGPLLAAFTGEHVGEPRVLICLYGPPLLHVDLKFVALPDAAERIEDPTVLWERDGRLSDTLRQPGGEYPVPDLQWIEDRFWVWVHYGTDKIARGELLEAHDFLAFVRFQVLGPLALLASGARPAGVRRVERDATAYLPELRQTLATYEPVACATALRAAARLYVSLRSVLGRDLELRAAAEREAVQHLQSTIAALGGEDPP